ncbi:MAG: metal-dependent transcriptional regulator [Thermoplasmata archaeon]|nr:metal-dependent transcriptional regulator [Thermoplasmata archaeon]
METLQRLTRRQVETLAAITGRETPEHGASLKAIAQALKVSAPSALAHVTLLERLALVSRFRGKSRLSTKGQTTYLEYLRHHRIAEGLFSQLGLPPGDVCAAAHEVDLAMSHRTVERLCQAERHPTVCPHGDPIPPCASDH